MLIGKIKVGKTQYKYINHPECPICMAEENGKSLRPEIDRFLVSHSVNEAPAYLLDLGINLTPTRIKTHINKHSAYIMEAKAAIQKAAESHALSRIDKLEEFMDADEVIQDIITIGGRKLQTGEMEVDSKLLLGALKEQGLRKKVGTIRELMEDLDKQRFKQIPVIEGEADGEENAS